MMKPVVDLQRVPAEGPSSCSRLVSLHGVLALFAMLSFLAAPLSAWGQSLLEKDFSLRGNDSSWTLEADRVESLQKEQVFEAHGDVLISHGQNTIRADRATYFRETGFAHLQGNVRIQWEGDLMTGETADFDLRNNVGWVTDGEMFIVKDHYYIRGRLLEKTCADTYAFQDAHITTCDGPVPAWSLRSSEGKVTTGGYARLWHPRFQVMDKPVLYSPYMIFPVKTERQSGFLIPEPSYSSRLGVGLNIPYYWVINEEQDATFYANMLSKRGVMTGVEYRHFTNPDSKGVWRADWMHDKVTAAAEEEEDPQFRGDGLARENSHRYWVRAKYDGFLGDPLWRTKLDLDIVSDQNYLREFKHGYSGYNQTHDQMLRDFGRGMNRIDHIIRSNAMEISRNWTRLGFRGGLRYDQNLAYWTDNLPNSENETLQRLPELNLDLYKMSLGQTPFEIEANNQAVYFWREFGTTGSRFDFFPRISLPWTTGVGTLTPSAGWRQTFYAVNSHENSPDGVDDSKKYFERGIPEYRVDAFSSLFRVYVLGVQDSLTPTLENVGNRHWSRIRHTVQPELRYIYVPERDQSSNPLFDRRVDRIGKANYLSYTLINTFNRRMDRVVQRESGHAGQNSEALRANADVPRILTQREYRDFLSIRLDQTYDFEEADRDDNLERYPDRRPFSDIRAEIGFHPGRFISLWNRTWYSPYMGRITEHEHMLQGSYPDVGTAYFGFDFRAEVDDIQRRNQRKREILRTGGLLHLPLGMTLRGDYKRDLYAREDLETILGLGYTHQCYFVEFLFSQTPDEDRYEIRFSLKGLEEIVGMGL